MRLLLLALLFVVFSVASRAAPAQVISIQKIEISSLAEAKGPEVNLPHFIEQHQSGLLKAHWTIRLPAQLHDAEIPALLIPQAVQGARFRLGGQTVYELTPSDEQTYRNWYSPALIQLPRTLLNPTTDTVLEVEQLGHLRGWFIAPMLAGELRTLQPLFESYAFISQTLNTTVNVLCGFLGIFLMALGLRSRNPLYLYGGLVAVLWSLVVGIALIGQFPGDLWPYWRLSLYGLTGWLVYCEIRFNFFVFQRTLRPAYAWSMLIFMNAGWLAFAIFGKPAELFLDTVWTSLVVVCYFASVVWLIGIAIARRDWRRAIPVFLFLLLAMALSFHDYALQTGVLPIHLPDTPQALWQHLALQPIYLAHLALPGFIALTLWLVGKQHMQFTRNQLLHELQLSQERERIVSDIHDGVGARINLLLWRLRTRPPEIGLVSNELQGCMDELRFAINPPQSGDATLHKTLEALVQRLATEHEGIRLEYQRIGHSATEVSSEIGLHLYKASQECLSNAIRHSGATHICVRLDHRAHELEIAITDNGHGIPQWDNDTQQQVRRSPTSMGLLGLQKRMAQRHGHCRIDSCANGTQVRLVVPV